MSEGDTNLRAGRGRHRPCRILAKCRKTPYPARLTEMEKWSWIRIRNPISTKIELVLEVHPLLPPTKFGGDPWTRSWDILRTKRVRTDRQTDTRRWPQDLAAYGAQVINGSCRFRVDCRNLSCLTVSVSVLEEIWVKWPKQVKIAHIFSSDLRKYLF